MVGFSQGSYLLLTVPLCIFDLLSCEIREGEGIGLHSVSGPSQLWGIRLGRCLHGMCIDSLLCEVSIESGGRREWVRVHSSVFVCVCWAWEWVPGNMDRHAVFKIVLFCNLKTNICSK